MLTDATVQHVVKHSLSYGFVLSQPFAFYVDAYPSIQNNIIKESDVLYYGQHNESVKVLQHKLKTLSYFDHPIDGDFGVLTEYALKKFQKEKDLSITGMADRRTVNKLIIEEREKNLAPLRELSSPLRPGDTGKEIETIQTALYYFGYYKAEIDGIFGPLTAQALKSFQQDNGYEVQDHVSEKVIDAIYTAEPEASIDSDASAPAEEKTAAAKAPNPKEKSAPAAKEPKTVKAKSAIDVAQVMKTAKQLVGTPYVWGGDSPQGFDCSGLIQYIYKELGIQLPRTVNELWNITKPVDSPSVGDFVFFQTYRSGPSHMGIYVGDGQFLHAGESRGVEISRMDNSYWQPRYLGAKRLNTQ
ncbi:NlpC/P60 family protein [Sediminibacillus albus]|uniref:Cell wall-associated hydrolase, NlpC family n=1 Tax=Sediminibacillus albus TaxID=407036 RepID=A0A1G8VSI7_9BACI|nr:NlpC/P60 family protein [Sediminibacillus albus]SDJ68395.1 Cell wall-associated hydrolase, NlpC family [Sediminibacillus albus]